MMISKDKVVSMHYVLNDAEGELIDSSEGNEPLVYLHGHNNIIPGLEEALEGKSVGDKVSAVVPPEQAYGVWDEDMVHIVAIDNFEQPDMVEIGAQFHVQTEDNLLLATVIEIDGDDVTIDMNHPLADQTLYFDVEIADIRDANAEEKAHGHVHSHGGHTH